MDTTIKLSTETKKQLDSLKSKGESYDNVINRILKEIHLIKDV